MNAPSKDVRAMLEDDSTLDLTYGTNLFIGREPAKVDECVIVFDTVGFPPQLTLAGKGEDYFYPSIQIRVRNNKYTDGYDLIKNIMTSLHGRANETWNGTLYIVIYATSEPALLDWDDNKRVSWIINFNLQRR